MKLVLATPGKAAVRGTQERLSVRDLIAESDLTRQDLHLMFELAADVKAVPAMGTQSIGYDSPSPGWRRVFCFGYGSPGRARCTRPGLFCFPRRALHNVGPAPGAQRSGPR